MAAQANAGLPSLASTMQLRPASGRSGRAAGETTTATRVGEPTAAGIPSPVRHGRWADQPPLKLPGIQSHSRCSSSCSSIRTSRKESFQAASTVLLGAQPLVQRAKTDDRPTRRAESGSSIMLTSSMTAEKSTKGHVRGRTRTPSHSSLVSKKHDKDGSDSPVWSPSSAMSTVASLGGELSDFSMSSRSLSRSHAGRSQLNAEWVAGAEAHAKSRAERSDESARSSLSLPTSEEPQFERLSRKAKTIADMAQLVLPTTNHEDEEVRTERLLNSLLSQRSQAPNTHRHSPGGSPVRSRRNGTRLSLVPLPALEANSIRQLGPEEKIFDLYHWSEVLQEEGDGGKVVVCKPKALMRQKAKSEAPSDENEEDAKTERGDKSYVMKIRSKDSLEEQRYLEQFRKCQQRLLNLPAHPGVIQVCEVLEDEKFMYIVMEMADGGSLFSSLLSKFEDGVMPAGAVRKLMREIIEAVDHVHKQGILHRDIKPDNLVMRTSAGEDEHNKVALIDFDHADPEWDPRCTSVQLNEFCGTVHFSAPEAFVGRFSQSSDLYSVGVILYLLMTGNMPYSDDIYNDEVRRRQSANKFSVCSSKAAEQMQASEIDWECNPWPEQGLCRDFCKSLLEFDPSARPPSAEEALSHAWFTTED